MRKPYTLLGLLGLIAIVSSCALNGMFLAPYELHKDDIFSGYVEEFEDTLTLSFTEEYNPQIHDSQNNLVGFDYSMESVFFENRRGDSINGWIIKPKEDYNGTTIYFLHGNAGNVAYNYTLAAPFAEVGYQVFLIDYSGFGFSQGKAKRQYVLTDANDGLDYLLSREDLKHDHLLIYGQSLGGHLAGVVATQNQSRIDGVIIEGAFSSHKDIAAEKVPLLGRIFTREMYSAERSLPLMKKPVLIIHSTEDQTVDYNHGEVLYEAATEPKVMYTIDKPHIRGPLFYADSIVKLMENMIQE
ncbi:MAG: alpha/beta fold hydrolase [Crocinitomicaceae bacterium]|nr:alpha/beta fold hydrolase [Crocinitomicaceae bacterium]